MNSGDELGEAYESFEAVMEQVLQQPLSRAQQAFTDELTPRLREVTDSLQDTQELLMATLQGRSSLKLPSVDMELEDPEAAWDEAGIVGLQLISMQATNDARDEGRRSLKELQDHLDEVAGRLDETSSLVLMLAGVPSRETPAQSSLSASAAASFVSTRNLWAGIGPELQKLQASVDNLQARTSQLAQSLDTQSERAKQATRLMAGGVAVGFVLVLAALGVVLWQALGL